MANTPPSSKKRRLNSNIIKLIVGTGDDTDEFQVHEDYLKKHSAFFQTALNKNWKEGQERKIELPDDEPDVVHAYTEWLYNSKVPSRPHDTNDKALNSGRDNVFFAKLFVFGEKVQDDDFCDVVVTTIMAHSKENHNGGSLVAAKIIYDGTPQISPARQVMVHLFATHADRRHLGNETHKKLLLQNPELLFDVVHSLVPAMRYCTDISASVHKIREEWLKVKQ